VGGDPSRIAEIRGDQKVFKPRLFDPSISFVYAWNFEDDRQSAQYAPIICALAERLYQFGRGIDFACAWGEEFDVAGLEEILLHYPGTVHRPYRQGNGARLKCPARGSWKSLEDRYHAYGRRFHAENRYKIITMVFTKPPSARFVPVPYDSPPSRYTFDLRERSGEARFAVWPLEHIVRLVELLRDGSAAKLRSALPQRLTGIDRVFIGRKPDGSSDGPTTDRVRIMPLPSIGYYYADRGIRRVLIEVPANCPLRKDDVEWAFSGLELPSPNATEAASVVVTLAGDDGGRSMLAHYGVDATAHNWWRTVTPAALPEVAGRRRIDPKRQREEAKSGKERAAECSTAARAVVQALRHAGAPRANAIRVQREPFETSGERAEVFAEGSRFSKHRLWHVEIQFCDGIPGPMVIGDGRFLGLGIMAPAAGESAGRHGAVN
jgi:CRISPR-associated protein Csb2